MIVLKGIYKWVNNASNRVFILKDLDMEIKQGEFVSIMGPSGSGKTTLLNIMGMLESPSEGMYEFMGNNVAEL